jgi:Rod binding domain-containing protein
MPTGAPPVGNTTPGPLPVSGSAAAPALPVGTPGDPPRDPKVWAAAKKFEAMAIGQMLAPMFNTVDLSKSKFGGGQGESAWKPMMVDAIGKQIEAHGGFGLAQPVYAAMLRAQETRAQAGGALAGSAHAGIAQAGGAHAGGAHAGGAHAGGAQSASPYVGGPQAGSAQAGSAQAGSAQVGAARPGGVQAHRVQEGAAGQPALRPNQPGE